MTEKESQHRFRFDENGAHAHAGEFEITIKGNHVTIRMSDPLLGQWVQERDVQTHGEPIYSDLEGWMRRAGDGARVGFTLRRQSGGVIFFYDGREHTPVDPEKEGMSAEDALGYYDGGGFGYIYSMANPHFDELGTAPFPLNHESIAEYNARIAAQQDMIESIFGGNVVKIDMTQGDTLMGADFDAAR